MKNMIPPVVRLILCGIEAMGLVVYPPMFSSKSVDLIQASQAPGCLNDLTIEVTADPSRVIPGQSSTVNWVIDIPPECGYAAVQLNGKSIMPSGSQTVTPLASTTYQVAVLLKTSLETRLKKQLPRA